MRFKLPLPCTMFERTCARNASTVSCCHALGKLGGETNNHNGGARSTQKAKARKQNTQHLSLPDPECQLLCGHQRESAAVVAICLARAAADELARPIHYIAEASHASRIQEASHGRCGFLELRLALPRQRVVVPGAPPLRVGWQWGGAGGLGG